MSSSTHDVQSNGIAIKFPFEPYSSQLDYIDKVTRALIDSTNVLLESPTGTGKTLCLLCASLGWQVHNKSKLPKNVGSIALQYNEGPKHKAAPMVSIGAARPSVVIYASRTHAQLAQVVSELRSSGYSPRMTVLGSREQLCIHSRISKLKGSTLNHACNTTSANRGCMFKNNLDSYHGTAEGIGDAPSPILDIEQLNELGKKDQICPYFFSRDSSTTADLVLVPYNYLVDTSIRATLKLSWENAVIIFDEAHNLESVASDATSFSLSSTDIASYISELQQVVRLLQSQISDTTSGQEKSKESGNDGKGGSSPPNIDRVISILRYLFDFERRVDSVPLSSIPNMGSINGKVFTGRWLFDLLEQCGFRVELVAMYVEEIIRCSDFLMTDISSLVGDVTSMGGRAPEPKLGGFAKALLKVFRGKSREECVHNAGLYKVFICEDQKTASKSSYVNNKTASVTNLSACSTKKRILNYWCFSTGLAVEEIKRLGVRSIILTSGTLSPMGSFKDDLRVPFPLELENPHVINERRQIWVGALSAGPTGKELNSSFAHRDLSHSKDELGNTILMICQTMVGGSSTGSSGMKLPTGPELKGGVLIFFPSYGALESARNHWVDSGLWTKLCGTMGHIVVETKAGGAGVSGSSKDQLAPGNKTGFKQKPFSLLENDNSNSYDKAVESSITEFENALRTTGGKCVLMAVCRGKMSEGIDFRDSKGRLVIITGIPYAPHMDPWVVLKRDYLAAKCSGSEVTNAGNALLIGSGGISKAGPLILSGGVGKQLGLVFSAHSIYGGSHAGGNVSATLHGGASYVQTVRTFDTSAAPSAGRITGQAWYEQSAMRAVNQALGRVIRHKNDWGVVFLLDSRFQQPSRISYLSKWVRPSVRKYTSLLPALTDFRSFITNAIQDPTLTPIVKQIKQTSTSSYVPYVPHPSIVALNSYKSNSVPHREVTISAAALGISRDFVDPSLLMTQPAEDDSTLISNSMFAVSKSKGFRDAGFSSNQSSDIGTIISEAKSAGSISQSNADAINPQTKKSLFSVLSGRASSGAGEKENAKNFSSLSTSTFSRQQTATPAVSVGIASGHNKYNGSTHPTGAEAIGLKSEEHYRDALISAENDSGRSKFLKVLADQLQSRLPADVFSRFINEVGRIVQSPKSIESVTMLRQFVDSVSSALAGHLRPQALLETMTRLVPLIPPRHVNIYNSITKKLCQTQSTMIASEAEDAAVDEKDSDISARARSGQQSATSTEPIAAPSTSMPFSSGPLVSDFRVSRPKSQATARYANGDEKSVPIMSKFDNILKRVHSQVGGDGLDERDDSTSSSQAEGGLSQSVVNASSKRARSMALQSSTSSKSSSSAKLSAHSLLLSQRRPSTAASPSTQNAISLFEKVGSIIVGNSRPSTSSKSLSSSRSSSLAQMTCIVCSEKVLDPYAARCGHVCCLECWRSWLKSQRKESCPLCRRAVEYSQLTKIVVKD